MKRPAGDDAHANQQLRGKLADRVTKVARDSKTFSFGAPTAPVFLKLNFQRMIRLYRILPWLTCIMSKCTRSVGRILVSLSSQGFPHHLGYETSETIQGNKVVMGSEAETCSKKLKHDSLKDELLENISEHQ